MTNLEVESQTTVPSRLDSIVFLLLMSGPPKLRDRDPTASLQGVIDSVVVFHIVLWACGAAWVFFRLYPVLIRRGVLPRLHSVQIVSLLLIAALSLSLWQSPGFMLSAFMLSQFAIMWAFAWVFVDRYGPETYVRHLFVGLCLLTLTLILAVILTPGVVMDAVVTNQGTQQRFRGERIAGTGPVAVLALVCCLSSVPKLRQLAFWTWVAIFAVLLATSRMRTAYAALLAYLPIGYAFGKGLRVRRLVPLLLLSCFGLIAFDAFSSATDYVVRETNSIETMSDRLPLWTFLTTTVMHEEPLIGLGYYAASRILGPQYNPGLGNAHSVFFEILVGGGLIGAAMYVVLCASLLSYAARLLRVSESQPAESIAIVGLLLVTLVLGLTSSEAANAGPVGFCFWSMTALVPAMYRQAAAKTHFERSRFGEHGALMAGRYAGRYS